MPPQAIATLKEIDNLKSEILLSQSKASGNLKAAIQDQVRYLWTYNSNAIEGNGLSLDETIFFLQEGLTVSGKPFKHFIDATNHSEAISYLFDAVQNKYPVNANFLCSLNAILLKGVDSTSAKGISGNKFDKKLTPGVFKSEENYVQQLDGTLQSYVEHYLVPSQIDGLCKWINSNPDNYHPAVVAAIAHYNHVRIHPFQDGNGRGSRILLNLILINHKFSPVIIEVSKRREYISSLKAADSGDLLPTIQFVADSIKNTQTMLLDEINSFNSKMTITKQ